MAYKIKALAQDMAPLGAKLGPLPLLTVNMISEPVSPQLYGRHEEASSGDHQQLFVPMQ